VRGADKRIERNENRGEKGKRTLADNVGVGDRVRVFLPTGKELAE